MFDPRASARFRRNRAAMLGAALVLALVVFALIGPLLATHDPYTSDFARGVSDTKSSIGPGREFLLGTDRIFRDELARLARDA